MPVVARAVIADEIDQFTSLYIVQILFDDIARARPITSTY